MRLDSSGNLGLGVTPSAWSTSVQTALQVYTAGVSGNGGGNTASRFTHGCYLDGSTWKYQYTGVGPARYEITGPNSGSTHSWSIAAGGTAGNAISFTQAMTLDASGRLGIENTSPGSLHPSADDLVIGAGSGNKGLTVYSGTTGTGAIYFADGTSGADAYRGWLEYNHSTDALTFGTNATERARITSAGYGKFSNDGTYYGATGGSYHEMRNNSSGSYVTIFSNTHASNPFGLYVEYSGAAPNGTGNQFLRLSDNIGERCTIRSNGGIANYSANDVNLSDRREKTNFAPAKSYLDTICAIPVQTFNYIDQSENDPGLTLGVVAQDVQAVAPELVMESNWGTEDDPKMRLSIYQTDLQYALMKAIQELKSELDTVKAELATLKGNP
jgi:hypothetical protein